VVFQGLAEHEADIGCIYDYFLDSVQFGFIYIKSTCEYEEMYIIKIAFLMYPTLIFRLINEFLQSKSKAHSTKTLPRFYQWTHCPWGSERILLSTAC